MELYGYSSTCLHSVHRDKFIITITAEEWHQTFLFWCSTLHNFLFTNTLKYYHFLTKAIFTNKCANVITINALVPIFLSSIILQKPHHDISWLPTQVTDMYCTHPSSSCPAGNSSTSPHKWVAADLLLSRIIYRGNRRWLKGQALELVADEPTIKLPHLSIECWNVQILRSTIAIYFLFHMNHWLKKILLDVN